MILSSLGFIGWDSIEPVILSSLTCYHPILFVGLHGCNKTDGARILSEELIGPECEYRKYDLRFLRQDDFLGYADPSSLMKGTVTHIPTAISIWNADAVLIDEINRVNPMVASKAMELVREKTVMGLKTKVQYVFGSLNPPGAYSTSYLDPALASRFSICRVPSTEDLATDDHIGDIVSLFSTGGKAASSGDKLRSLIFSARKKSLTVADKKAIASQVTMVVGSLLRKGIAVQPREIRSIVHLLFSLRKLEMCGYTVDIAARADVILSKIPELFGVCREKVDYSTIRAFLRESLASLELDPDYFSNDPNVVLSSDTLRKEDRPFWLASMRDACDDSSSSVLLEFIKNLGEFEDITPDEYNMLAHTCFITFLKNSDTVLPADVGNLDSSHGSLTLLVKKFLSGTMSGKSS